MAGFGRRRGMPVRVALVERFALVAVVATLVAGLAAPGAAAAARTADRSPASVIVVFKDAPGAAARHVVESLGGRVTRSLRLVGGLVAVMPENAIAGLARNPLVQSVELDGTVRLAEPTVQAESTGDLEYDNAWGVTHIGSKAAHDSGIRGQGVKVAVIDTGIDYVHNDPDDDPYVVDPEFTSNYRGGYDFYNDDADPMDDNGHGTHVAGILAAEKNGYLVVGVAPQVDLYALKILGAGGEGDVSGLILALQWAVDNDMDVANMSLGTHEVSPALELAVQNAAAAGLLMVAASGNVNPLVWQELLFGCPVAYPGAYPEVLSTTFTNPSDALTGYSCTGPEVDFGSPGDGIFSPVPVGDCMFCSPYGYSSQSGTSMASPHLAGTVALLLSAGIGDSGAPGRFDDVRNRLCTTANLGWGVQTGFSGTPIPPSDPRYAQYFGCGIVDAAEAVQIVVPPPVNAPPVASADDLDVTEDVPTDLVVLANDVDPDGDSLTVSSATGATHGTTDVNPDGTVRYAPEPNFVGDDSFDYVIADGQGGSDSASVVVHVTPVNDAPVAVDDSATTPAGTPVTISVLANDTDIEGSALAVASVSDPPHGAVVINPNGTVTYSPDPGYSGPDAFGYSATDGSTMSNLATVSITVSAPPPPNPFHVGDLDGSTASGKTWTARVTIRIHGSSHAPVSGVTVTGTWSDGATGTVSCRTGSNGTCTVQVSKLNRTTVASVRLTVTAASRSGWTYVPAANHDPDGDSTGTTIVVSRPG